MDQKTRDKYQGYLSLACVEAGIDSRMVDAMIQNESGWNPWAIRLEPAWKDFERPTFWAENFGLSLQTEINCQKQSYGLGQIMGGVARALGYADHLTKLHIPEQNIDLMVKLIAKLKRSFPDSMLDVVAAYNGGYKMKRAIGNYANQGYVDEFLATYKSLEPLYKK